VRVPDLQDLVRLVARGADSAREEARRVAEELVARGELGREEAAAIEAAVADAVASHRVWLEQRVLRPLRELLGRGVPLGPADAGLETRLAALEERLARIERKLDGSGAA
jgi:polyhydroxyalkanoate synthesis regulator phasin